jgi:hypothetical protein
MISKTIGCRGTLFSDKPKFCWTSWWFWDPPPCIEPQTILLFFLRLLEDMIANWHFSLVHTVHIWLSKYKYTDTSIHSIQIFCAQTRMTILPSLHRTAGFSSSLCPSFSHDGGPPKAMAALRSLSRCDFSWRWSKSTLPNNRMAIIEINDGNMIFNQPVIMGVSSESFRVPCCIMNKLLMIGLSKNL